MGRKTWESIPECFRPLKKRKNYIISSKLLYQDYVFKSLKIALLHAKRDPHCDTIFIIGGEQLYKEAILSCDEIILSVIRKKRREQGTGRREKHEQKIAKIAKDAK